MVWSTPFDMAIAIVFTPVNVFASDRLQHILTERFSDKRGRMDVESRLSEVEAAFAQEFRQHWSDIEEKDFAFTPPPLKKGHRVE